jgi:hypothetical protein
MNHILYFLCQLALLSNSVDLTPVLQPQTRRETMTKAATTLKQVLATSTVASVVVAASNTTVKSLDIYDDYGEKDYKDYYNEDYQEEKNSLVQKESVIKTTTPRATTSITKAKSTNTKSKTTTTIKMTTTPISTPEIKLGTKTLATTKTTAKLPVKVADVKNEEYVVPTPKPVVVRTEIARGSKKTTTQSDDEYDFSDYYNDYYDEDYLSKEANKSDTKLANSRASTKVMAKTTAAKPTKTTARARVDGGIQKTTLKTKESELDAEYYDYLEEPVQKESSTKSTAPSLKLNKVVGSTTKKSTLTSKNPSK